MEGLIHHFDGVPPDCLEGFVTLRRKVIPGFRFVKCLRLLQAVPLGDGYTLGSRPLQCNNLSTASAQIATTRRLLRSLDKRDERGVGRSIEGFELGWFDSGIARSNTRSCELKKVGDEDRKKSSVCESALADSRTGCPFALTEIRHSRSRTALDKIHLALSRRKSENDRW